MASSSLGHRSPAVGHRQADAGEHRAVPIHQGVVDLPGQPRELGDVDHPDAHGRPVPELVALDLLDGVAERVPVVEDLAQRRPPRRSCATTSAFTRTARSTSSRTVRRRRPCAPPSGSASTRSRMAGSAMKPHLMTSASPATKSCEGRVSSVARSHSTPAGGWNAPDEVLALGGVDPGLAADRRVDHAEQRGRHVDDADAAQPGRGDEPGEVGRRVPPPDAHDRIAAGEPRLPEDTPEEGGDLRGLGLLGVRHLRGIRLEALGDAGPHGPPRRWRPGRAGGRRARAGRPRRRRPGSSSSSPVPITTS